MPVPPNATNSAMIEMTIDGVTLFITLTLSSESRGAKHNPQHNPVRPPANADSQ
jgi:hypothetical protein